MPSTLTKTNLTGLFTQKTRFWLVFIIDSHIYNNFTSSAVVLLF
jgi:hypothetical protein